MQLNRFLRLAGSVGAISLLGPAAGILLGVILARWLQPEGYGIYAFVMAAMFMLLAPARFGLPEWVMREIAAGNSDPTLESTDHWALRTLLVAIGISVALALFVSAIVLAVTENPVLKTAFLVGVWILPLTAALDTIAHVFRGWGCATLAQFLIIVPRTLFLLVGIVAAAYFWRGESHPGLALAVNVGATTLAVFISLAILFKTLRNRPTSRPAQQPKIGAMLRGAFPFMLIGSATVVMSRTDVIMLGLLSSTKDAGIYNVAVQGALLVQLIQNVANTVSAPEFARLYAAKDIDRLERYAVMTARSLAVIGVPVALFLIYFGADLLAFFFGPVFAVGGSTLAILAAGYCLSFAFGAPGFLLNMTGYEKISLKIVVISAFLNVGLNVALIPSLGIVGAALATAVSLNVQKALGWWVVRKRLGISCACLNVGVN